MMGNVKLYWPSASHECKTTLHKYKQKLYRYKSRINVMFSEALCIVGAITLLVLINNGSSLNINNIQP